MPRLHCNPGAFSWGGPRGGAFRPQGKLSHHGPRPNPELWSSTETLAARLFVGFNVGKEAVWSVDDLIEIVKRVRLEQIGDASASFIAQQGIYQHADPALGMVVEHGAQVIIINMADLSAKDCEHEMVRLAEVIAIDLEQESVIVEIQKNGITQKTIGVGPA